MDKIKIKGGADLFGSIDIPGSKNAALPVMVSSLLSKENLNLHNLPKLQDMNSMISLLRSFGVSVNQNNNTLILNSQNLKNSTAGYDLVGTVGERYRSPDVVGDHPVANNVTITNYSLEQCTGSKPFNGSTDATHVDDFNSMVHFLGYDTASGDGTKIEEISDAEHQGPGQVIARCNAYFTSSANTVGSYHIGTAAGDSDTSSWHDETWYTDTVITSSGSANVAYHFYRKESGIARGWSGTRSLSNANTEARAANCVTHWSGANADYIATNL